MFVTRSLHGANGLLSQSCMTMLVHVTISKGLHTLVVSCEWLLECHEFNYP